MKLGVITDGISRDFDHALTVMTDAGLEYAELQYIYDKEVGEMNADERKCAQQIIKKYGAKVSCISRHVFVGLPLPQTKPGSDAHKAHMEGLQRCIEMAHELECKVVRIMSGRKELIISGKNGADHWLVSKGAWDALAPLVEPAVRVAEREGIQLVIETGFTGMVFSAWCGRQLIDHIGSRHLKLLWDPANCLYAHEQAWPEGYECLRGGYIGHIHMKDIAIDTAKGYVEFRRLGQGQMGPMIEDLAKALRAEKFDGVVSLESVYRPIGGTFEDGFNASIAKFKSVFG
jgi:sugar phosphate isomerase/epimerase